MKIVLREQGETLDALIRRSYSIRSIDGYEDQQRVERIRKAVLETNLDFDKGLREVKLPELPGIPYLYSPIDNIKLLRSTFEQVLHQIEHDPHLVALSFIDPIRLCRETIGTEVITNNFKDDFER